MAQFMSDKYMLNNPAAQRIYSYVKDLPIFDYHCHLCPKEIFEDKKFYNLTELWLLGDHYKWRVMRAFGVDERHITGEGEPYQKFYYFAKALPHFLGNPVYHWAHLELKRYFGIVDPICESNAKKIWDLTEKAMADGSFSAKNLIRQSNVECLITTDDPIDNLAYHKLLKEQNNGFLVLPCMRPDAAINIEKAGFAEYIKKLADCSDVIITDFNSLVDALEARLKYFIKCGATASDIGLTNYPYGKGDYSMADNALKQALCGKAINSELIEEYKFCLLSELGKLFAKRNIVMQLHAGALRNQNTKLYNKLGADSGIDSVGNALNIEAAGRLFDVIESVNMPKTIVYTLNPNSYYPLATLVGDFAGETRGKLQLGAAWWFLDHRDGIVEQLKILAATGGLGLFNGMLTDSRSFSSYPRHDYFRRILSSVIGEWVESSEYPDDEELLREIASNICYYNAKRFFSKE